MILYGFTVGGVYGTGLLYINGGLGGVVDGGLLFDHRWDGGLGDEGGNQAGNKGTPPPGRGGNSMSKDKNRPQEVSSKQPVSVLRDNNLPKKPRYHDPRFDRAIGSFNEDLFKKSFSFINDMQQNERKQLEKAAEKEKDPMKKQELKLMLQRQKSIEQTKRREESRKKILRDRKKVEAELVAQGKKPFYLKKADVKRLEMVEKYKELKSRSQDGSVDIDKVVEKKRKHKASKQHKFLPNA